MATKSYQERQDAWIKEHDLKVGDRVLVVRKTKGHACGWENSWADPEMKARKTKKYTIEFIEIDSTGILLSDGYRYPYMSLEPVKAVKQPKTTTSMKDLKEFGVKASSFALYKAFKEEAEAKGWKYLSAFSNFTPTRAEGSDRCLWFAQGPTLWSSITEKQTKGFALSGSSAPAFNLPQDWDAAIEALNVKVEPESVKVNITGSDYYIEHGEFDIEIMKNGILKCGCQTYSKKDATELLSAIKNLYETKVFNKSDSDEENFLFMKRGFKRSEIEAIIKNYESFVGVKL